jgi:hypothetical protein
MKLDAFYSENDPYVQKVSDRAAELVRRKATITSDDEKTCIPDNIAGMARVALYDVVLLCGKLQAVIVQVIEEFR